MEIENIKWENKEKKFKTDKVLHDNLNCKHLKTIEVEKCDDENDRVYDVKYCLDCKEII